MLCWVRGDPIRAELPKAPGRCMYYPTKRAEAPAIMPANYACKSSKLLFIVYVCVYVCMYACMDGWIDEALLPGNMEAPRRAPESSPVLRLSLRQLLAQVPDSTNHGKVVYKKKEKSQGIDAPRLQMYYSGPA